MKKLISILIGIVMCLNIFTTGVLADTVFTDVTPDDWFYNDVKGAVELGLVNGKTPTTYAPNDNLTYAEAIKLAACMNQLYTDGDITLASGDPWYKPYVEYCLDNGIIDREYTYSEKATRYGYMYIFAHALPDKALKEVNNVPDNSIPDVQVSTFYAPEVYKLYRAGILTGVDDEHRCNPHATITRAEVAAILTRMMNESARIKFDMGEGSGSGGSSGGDSGGDSPTPEHKTLTISSQPADKTVKLGETARTTVVATGGKKPYTYQWQVEAVSPGGMKTWFNINGEGSSFSNEKTDTLSVAISTESKKSVRCNITDADGCTITSDVAVLEFTSDKIPLSVKVESEEVEAKVGESVTLKVTEQGGKAPHKYQWQIKNESDVWIDISDNPFFAGTQTASLEATLTEKTLEVFRCIITDAEGEEVISKEITLNVGEDEAEFIVKTHPADTLAQVGEEMKLFVEVQGGTPPYTYQWQIKSGKNYISISDNSFLNGTKEQILTLKSNAQTVSYFRCIIKDSKGNELKSNLATVKVEAAVEYLADVKMNVEGIEAASVGVIIWGKLETGAIKVGDTLYLNSAENDHMATFEVVKLEKDRTAVTSVNAVNAGDSTIGILTDLDKSQWDNANATGCVVSTIKGTVWMQFGGGSDSQWNYGTITYD